MKWLVTDGITTASSRGTACLILGDPQLFDKYKKWPGDRVSSSRVSATRLNFWKRIDLDVSRGCSFFEEREGGREEEEKKKIDWSVGRRRWEGSISRGLDTRESNIAGDEETGLTMWVWMIVFHEDLEIMLMVIDNGIPDSKLIVRFYTAFSNNRIDNNSIIIGFGKFG